MAPALHPLVLADEEQLQGAVLPLQHPTPCLREPALLAEAHPHRCIGFQVDRGRLLAGDHQQVSARARDRALPDDDTPVVLDYDLFPDFEFAHFVLRPR